MTVILNYRTMLYAKSFGLWPISRIARLTPRSYQDRGRHERLRELSDSAHLGALRVRRIPLPMSIVASNPAASIKFGRTGKVVCAICPSMHTEISQLAAAYVDLATEIAWFERALSDRFTQFPSSSDYGEMPPPPETAYGESCTALGLTANDRLIAILALMPWVAPRTLDPFLLKNAATDRCFTEFGGYSRPMHAGFLPTRQTAIFMLAGSAVDLGIAAMARFRVDAPLQYQNVLLSHDDCYAPWLPIEPHPQWIARQLG